MLAPYTEPAAAVSFVTPLATSPAEIITELEAEAVVTPSPFDPLDPSVDFQRPYEPQPDELDGPSYGADPNPALDAEQVAGGGWTCTSYRERNRIPENHRREGITVAYVQADMTHWILQGGVKNEHWIAWRGGSFTGGTPAIIRGGNADPNNFPPEARWVLK